MAPIQPSLSATGLMAVMAGTYGANTAITDGSDGRDIWRQYSHHSQPMALCHRAFYAQFFNLRASQHIAGYFGLAETVRQDYSETGRAGMDGG